MAQNGTLSTNQRRAIGALLASKTIREAADRAGLGERTLHRYLADLQFTAELNRQTAAVIGQAGRRLVKELEASIDALVEIRNDKDATPAQRMRAADLIMEHMTKTRMLEAVENRLAALEELVYARLA